MLCGPVPSESLPVEIYGKLVADTRAGDTRTIVDLSPPRLNSALEGEPDIVKVNDWQLGRVRRRPGLDRERDALGRRGGPRCRRRLRDGHPRRRPGADRDPRAHLGADPAALRGGRAGGLRRLDGGRDGRDARAGAAHSRRRCAGAPPRARRTSCATGWARARGRSSRTCFRASSCASCRGLDGRFRSAVPRPTGAGVRSSGERTELCPLGSTPGTEAPKFAAASVGCCVIWYRSSRIGDRRERGRHVLPRQDRGGPLADRPLRVRRDRRHLAQPSHPVTELHRPPGSRRVGVGGQHVHEARVRPARASRARPGPRRSEPRSPGSAPRPRPAPPSARGSRRRHGAPGARRGCGTRAAVSASTASSRWSLSGPGRGSTRIQPRPPSDTRRRSSSSSWSSIGSDTSPPVTTRTRDLLPLELGVDLCHPLLQLADHHRMARMDVRRRGDHLDAVRDRLARHADAVVEVA